MAQPTAQPTQPQKVLKKRRRISQEKGMLLLAGFFFLGVLLLSMIPEETPLRAIVMPLYSMAVMYSLYKWCV